MPESSTAVTLGIAGIGGFAKTIANRILQHGPKTTPRIRLVAVCDPMPDAHPDQVARLRAADVRIHDDFQAILDNPGIEAVWLPVPIDLHRPFTERALEAGKAVMVEKPVAGSVDDVDAIIAARDRSGLPVAVGFHDIYDADTLSLKQRLLAGEFGKIHSARLMGTWPRDSAYFARARWAGRIRINGTWVLDSPANNAMAHYINLALFLLGPSLEESATPLEVEAELYRAAPIENYDTVSLRTTVEGGATLLTLMTHACAQTHHPVIRLDGEKGSIFWALNTEARAVQTNPSLPVITNHTSEHQRMAQRFARLVRGLPSPDTLVSTLESARCHTVLINGVSEAARIVAAPESSLRQMPVEGGDIIRISGIEDIFHRCFEHGQMLHESGLLPFTQPAGRRDLRGYNHFAGPKT